MSIQPVNDFLRLAVRVVLPVPVVGNNVPECPGEILPKVREAMNSDDWLALPDKFEIDEYRIMRDFCATVANPALAEDLLDTIGGSGTFRRFKNMLHRHRQQDDWHKFRDRALRKFAVVWLEAHNLAHSD